ncbi:SDR family oxidoreductase [Pontibacter beigongshangensis]|uniref:SDR family oxidoreductase n=1 Tax=Pontibacter beigongshangensis TaxID=2574733 RepID=UPI0016506D62|nr:SDR family oxidoreductase [Pontibacter beigongshangensis]
MSYLIGKRALVSGGGSGIGLAIAGKLSEAGVQTVIADILPVNDLPPQTLSFLCDVASGPQVDTLFAELIGQVGQPDILVCCAGRGIHEKLAEGDPEKWQQIINTNLTGALRLVRAFVPGMIAAGQGHVVFLSSVAARHAYPYGGIYAASKAALEVVAETLRQEVLPAIRVTVVAPGVTDTSFFENTVSGSHTAADIGYGALSPANVADAVLFALRQPAGVSVNQITIRPDSQPF